MKILKVGCLSVCLLLAGSVVAQTPDDEYYPYAAEREESPPVLQTDSSLFYRAIQQAPPDLYDQNTTFVLPYVALQRRGQAYRTELTLFEGVPVSSYHSGALRLMGAREASFAGAMADFGTALGAGNLHSFDFSEQPPQAAYRASVGFTDRNYLMNARLSIIQPFGNDWNVEAAIDARTGRDMHVDGVFTNSLSANVRFAKEFAQGHSLALTVMLAPSMRGTRLSSSKEAFSLTDNNLYNPAWGFQNGKMRNSRVRRDFVPMAVLSYRLPISATTNFSADFGAEYGTEKYSMLGWYDARTPMPDNYRKLPSYTLDDATALAWRAEDARYTQIDWDEMIRQNRMRGGEAAYALADRVDRLNNLTFNANFSTIPSTRLTLRYGIYYRREQTRSYEQMRNLLGAQYITDIDQFIADDYTYSDLTQNDLRHPNRAIREGDRFGYDYALVRRETEVRFKADYRADRFDAVVALSLGDAAIYRQGYYEKQLFPAEQSYGRSRRMHFTPYAIRAAAGWSFSPRSYLQFAAATGAKTPDAADLFYQPQYNNRTLDNPVPERFASAEFNYNFTGKSLTLRATAYATATFDETQSVRYFDDLAGVFSDMAVEGIGRIAYGVEAAADIRLSYRWQLSLSASAARYKYIRDPYVTVISDVDNSTLYARARSYVGDCTVGNAPQLTAAAELTYFAPKGWGARFSTGYAGARYVEPALLRRTERIAREAGITAEGQTDFTRQERLNDAFTLDASVFKTFYFDNSRLTFSLMLRNILGNDDTIYSGYESLRIRRLYAGDTPYYQPQATRYTYAYPRSFYFSVSYKF